MTVGEEFEEGLAFSEERNDHAFVVDLDGFEGPADVLLSMAREQKVDITQISILTLAEQYLTFITKMSDLNIDLAADYLVMAAWLAYLKSRLILPELDMDEEPTGVEMEAALRYQLRRLQSMQDAGKRLMTGPQRGIDFFSRGMPEKFHVQINTFYELSLYGLLKAYGDQKSKKEAKSPLEIEVYDVFSVEEALDRLVRLIGKMPNWSDLLNFLPKNLKGSLASRSALASTLAASLELTKEGKTSLKQSRTFGPIYVRGKSQGG